MLKILDCTEAPGMWPITANLADFKVAGKKIRELIAARFPSEFPDGRTVEISAELLPSPELAALLGKDSRNLVVRDKTDGKILARTQPVNASGNAQIEPDSASLRLRHPWQLLELNESMVKELSHNDLKGTVRNGVTIDGLVVLGEGSVLLPGVYIEGNVIIGKNCKIGPNCYIRGNTTIGDNCHVGQAVEIKNSLLGDKVSVGHLSYAGDTIICDHVNFGAGTVISNLRHDGSNHKFLVNNELVDTGRRKFGAVIGENVHTGIHTSIYPGRSLSKNAATLPGEVVSHSK